MKREQPDKVRLDKLLVDRGLAPSREKAEAILLTGGVLVNNVPMTKAGQRVAADVEIRLTIEPSRFVSRGGDKIDPAFEHFQIDLRDRVVIDVGASTGGFTDAMLQRGAARVYAIDVGYNQLAHRLRIDPRVAVHERTHARDLPAMEFVPRPTFATIDVSFIGLRKILEPVLSVLARPGEILALVKPQFELEPELISKGGVVRDEELQQQAVESVKQAVEALPGCAWQGVFASPLRGEKKGNQEYFVYFRVLN